MLHPHTLSLWGWISVCSPYSKLAWMSFSSIIQKAKGRLPALSLVHCRIERKHIRLIILPQEGAKAWCKHIHRSPEKVSESLKGKMVGISFQKSVTKDWVKWVLLKMQRQQCKTLRKIKKKKQRGNMTSTKDCGNCPATNHKDVQVCELPNCCCSVAKSCLTL